MKKWARGICNRKLTKSLVSRLHCQTGINRKGHYLIEKMIDLAFSKHQAAEVAVSCFNQNVAGLLLYPKLGFQPYAIEERQDKKGSRVGLIHMRLPKNASC